MRAAATCLRTNSIASRSRGPAVLSTSDLQPGELGADLVRAAEPAHARREDRGLEHRAPRRG